MSDCDSSNGNKVSPERETNENYLVGKICSVITEFFLLSKPESKGIVLPRPLILKRCSLLPAKPRGSYALILNA